MKRTGIPLAEALQKYCPQEWTEFDRCRSLRGYSPVSDLNDISSYKRSRPSGRDPNHPFLQYVKAAIALFDAFTEQLRSGSIKVNGYDSRLPADADAVTVPPDHWTFLSPDFERSSASGNGYSLESLRVRIAGSPKIQAKWETDNWVKNRIERAKLEGKVLSVPALTKEARSQLGDDRHQRALLEARKKYAPKSWSEPGRKSKRKIKTLD